MRIAAMVSSVLARLSAFASGMNAVAASHICVCAPRLTDGRIGVFHSPAAAQ